MFDRVVPCLYVILLAVFSSSAQAVKVIQSENDDRQYRYLELDNKLKVLLVSDPSAEKSAAALDVHVGSNQNPKSHLGLAHFLEHMLFLGTQKYPQPEDYQAFISQHGGNHNAYTSSDHTNYFFDINSEQLEPALDRFSQFFIAPLFNADYVDRERNAVHSEYKLKIKNDYLRALDARRQLMNPDYPGAKFSVGTLDTLKDIEAKDDQTAVSLRDALVDFYNEFYSANIMTLVVLSPKSLDEIEAMVKPRFSEIVNLKVNYQESDVTTYPEGFLPKQLHIVPIKETRQLTLSFPIPTSGQHYAQKPLHYLGNILGHEGEGSLLSFLKELGWAEGLSAGGGDVSRNQGSFSVSIQLTERGVRVREQVIALVFHMIERLADKGINEWRYEEDRQLAEIAFRFQEKADAMSTVSALANRMQMYRPEHILKGDYLYESYDPALIRNYLSYLRTDNVLISLMAPDLETSNVSPWYATPYKTLDVSEKPLPIKSNYARKLYFAKPNPFIPKRLGIKRSSLLTEGAVSTPPEKIKASGRFQAWYQQSDQFAVPKAQIRLRVQLPMASQSAEASALNKLLAVMVGDSLNEFSYPARLAGLSYSISAHSRGMDVSVSGYNDRQGLLLQRILEALAKPDLDRERFDSLKLELLRSWRNANKERPYVQLVREIAQVQFEPLHAYPELVAALEPVEFDSFKSFARGALFNAQVDALFYGNLYRQEALKLAALVHNRLLDKPEGPELTPAQVVQLRERGKPRLREMNIDHKDSAAVLYVQGLEDSVSDSATMALMRQVIEAPFYSSLRTEKQLGYVVMAAAMPLKHVPGSMFIVQSPVADEARLIEEIEGFLVGFEKSFPKDIEPFKSALINNLLEPPKSLREQGGDYWQSILKQDYGFERRQKMAQVLEGISRKQLLDYYRRVLLQENRRLWLLAKPLEDAENYQVIPQSGAYPGHNQVYTYR